MGHSICGGCAACIREALVVIPEQIRNRWYPHRPTTHKAAVPVQRLHESKSNRNDPACLPQKTRTMTWPSSQNFCVFRPWGFAVHMAMSVACRFKHKGDTRAVLRGFEGSRIRGFEFRPRTRRVLSRKATNHVGAGTKRSDLGPGVGQHENTWTTW